MRFPIIVPNFGTDDDPIRLCGWLVDEGDLVLAGDLVAEALIPGITFDIVVESDGRLIEIVKPIDSIINPGDIVAWVDDDPASWKFETPGA